MRPNWSESSVVTCLESSVSTHYVYKKVKRKVQGVPQSQVAAKPWHQEEEETNTKQNTHKAGTTALKRSVV